MSSPNDLTTLANAKSWLNSPAGATDQSIQRLLTAVSSDVLGWLQRPSLVSRSYTDLVNGSGTSLMMLKQWPVTGITSVQVDQLTITQAGTSTNYPLRGWSCDFWDGISFPSPAVLELYGYSFCQGVNNVKVTYQAGYLLSGESLTLADPSPTVNLIPYIVSQPYGGWIADNGVTYANGTALTLVTGSPLAGQYSIDPQTQGGYLFSQLDVGQTVLISYSYTPSAVEQVVLDMMGDRMSYRGRFGIKSQSLMGQESTTYDNSGMPEYARTRLGPFQKRTLT